MAPSQAFEPQQRVAGKYRLLRLLAIGGMGEVWIARNEATGADVALKVLAREASGSAATRQLEERFRQEARLSAMLAHRSIVKVFDLVEEDDGTLVLVLELLRGESLHQYLERLGPRPAVELVAILAPVLGALGHAHDLGIVHRDISPANIFLAVDPDGHVIPKLLDFGIAKQHKHDGPLSPVQPVQPVKTVDGDVLGTPRYVAPERIRGAEEIDGRADLFSVGVVLYEAITGISPFAASTTSASLAAVLERTVDPDPQIDPRLWLEIRRAMSKQPYERHATAQELATALRAAVGETEASLEACLQTTRPEVVHVLQQQPEDGPLSPSGPRSSGTAEVAVPARVTKQLSAWLVGGAALCVVLVVAVLGLARSVRSETATAPATGTAAAAVTPAPDPPAPSASASSAPSAAPRPTAAPTSHVRPASRSRPVATTPGF